MADRRSFLERFSRLGAGVLAASAVAASTSEARAQGPSQASPGKLKIMMKSAWGSDDPTRASFPFVHGLALADAGHEVRIFLIGEATYLMRKATAEAVMPVGWPALSQTHDKLMAKRIPVFA